MSRKSRAKDIAKRSAINNILCSRQIADDLLKSYRFKKGDYVKYNIYSGRVVRVEHQNARHTCERYDVLLFPHGWKVLCDSNDIVANPDGERDEWIATQQAEQTMISTYKTAPTWDTKQGWLIAWDAKQSFATIIKYQRLIQETL